MVDQFRKRNLYINVIKYVKTRYPQVASCMPVRNVTAKPEILYMLSSTRAFIPAQKWMARSTGIGDLKTGKG